MEMDSLPGSHEVEGSNPSRSTSLFNSLQQNRGPLAGCVGCSWFAGFCRNVPTGTV